MGALGPEVPNWTPPPAPTGEVLEGRYSRLEPLRRDHATALFAAYQDAPEVWDYMYTGPFETEADYRDELERALAEEGILFYAIQNFESGQIEGVASYLRIAPQAGSIEVGHIAYAPALQNTRAGTEAMYLMMKWVYEAGYRRYEWKCNALNRGSRKAAQRLGFSYEGVFRQAAVAKGRNRDTAWLASIDSEWPALKAAFETWLDPENFDEHGAQKTSLSTLTAPILVARDPFLD